MANPDALTWAVGTIGLVLSLLTAPLQAVWATLAYFDARVRTEGLDLELQLAEVFSSRTDVTR